MAQRNGRVVVLSDPLAGNSPDALSSAIAIARLGRLGFDVKHLVGINREHTVELCREAVATRPEAFVVAGDNLLLQATLEVLAYSGIPVGLIPVGTCVSTCADLGIPLDDPSVAADVIAAGDAQDIDLGLAEFDDGTSAYFSSILSADLAADAMRSAARFDRSRPSLRAYLAGAALGAWRLRSYPFTITFDDGLVLEEHAHIASVGNLPCLTGGTRLVPDANPFDGKLDFSLIRRAPMPHLEILARIREMMFQDAVPLHKMIRYRCESVRIESPSRRAVVANETEIGTLPVTVSVARKALRVLVP